MSFESVLFGQKQSDIWLLLREGPIVVAPRFQRTLFMSAKAKIKKREKDQKGLSIRVRVNLSYSEKEPQKVCAGLSLIWVLLKRD